MGRHKKIIASETKPVEEVKTPTLPPPKDGRALAKIAPSKDFFVDDMELFDKPKDYTEGYEK